MSKLKHVGDKSFGHDQKTCNGYHISELFRRNPEAEQEIRFSVLCVRKQFHMFMSELCRKS